MWVNKCLIFFPPKKFTNTFKFLSLLECKSHVDNEEVGKVMNSYLVLTWTPPQHPEAYCPQSQSARTRVRTVTAARFLPKKEEDEKRREFTF